MASGGSIDWVKESVKVPVVYCYELRDRGTYGFLLPSTEILPNGEETMDSVIDLIYQARRFNIINSTVVEEPEVTTETVVTTETTVTTESGETDDTDAGSSLTISMGLITLGLVLSLFQK